MSETARPIAAVRRSHDRFVALVTPLDDAQVQAPAYPTEWSIAQVASHLGSQAEIFDLFLTAGLEGRPAPGGDVFAPIWDRWNALPPAEQVRQSVTSTDALVTRLEHLAATDPDGFALEAFGRQLDLNGLAGMMLSEHSVHTWDVEVALDPAATISADAVELVIDTVAQLAGWSGRAIEGADPVLIETSAPARRFRLTLAPEVELAPVSDEPADGSDPLRLPAEAFVRLVAGRLDPDHTPAAVTDARVDQLRSAFPGF
jgi:uncharacterized protein (TIGR03083 family)